MATPPAPQEGSPDDIKMLQAAMSEASLIIHSPPDIPANAEILGVCGVSADNADQHKYGWMVADFLHWKTLFHKVGNRPAQVCRSSPSHPRWFPILANTVVSQTWLSSLDLLNYLDGIKDIDMSDDSAIKNIASEKDGQVIKVPNEADGYMAAFVRQVVESARSAVTRKTTLLIMVFAPVTPEHDICIDFGNPGEMRTYMTAEHLRETIHSAVGNAPLTSILVTPSAFTGGWLCRPWFMNQPACSSSDTMMRIIAKSCGGAFSEGFIRSFTHRDTPLLTDIQREKVRYDDPMPVGPTKLQTDLLHRFQRQIHETLEKRLSVLAQQHTFVFPQDDTDDLLSSVDSWVSFAPRKGRSVRFWAKQWLTSRPIIENANPFEFLGEAFGGSKQTQLFHLKYLAEIELDTCPGDWNKHVNGAARLLLIDASQESIPDEDTLKRVFDTIEFRASSMILAQIIAKAFNLPMPDNVKCRYWNDTTEGVDEEYYLKLQTAFGEVRGLFGQVPVLPGEKRHDYNFARFWRAARWLSAAIALKFSEKSRPDVENFVLKDVTRVFNKIQNTQHTLLLEDQAITLAGLKWLAALGLAEEKGVGVADSSTDRVASPDLANKNNQGTCVSAKEWIPIPGPGEGNSQGTAVSSTFLDAQIGMFSAKQIAFFSGEGPKLSVKAESKAKPATNGLVSLIAEAESSFAQGKEKPVAQDLLDDFASGQGEKQAQAVVQDEAEDLLGFEEDKPNEQATPPAAAVATPPTMSDETERLVKALLDGTLPGFSNVDPVHLLAQILSKTAKRREQDTVGDARAENSVGNRNETSVVKKVSDSVQGVGVNQTSRAFVPNMSGTPTELPASPLTIGPGNSRMNFLDVKMQSMAVSVPTPPQTPALQRLADKSSFEESTENKEEHEDLIQVASPQGPAGSGVAPAPPTAAASSLGPSGLVEGEDFWSRAWIKW
jgi:hypothetical protein